MSWKNVQYENGKYRTSEGGGGGGSSTFAGLDDVSFSNLQNGQVPKYNSTTQKWENANESSGGHTYSTTEQVVGTWIDGKPIYEKVYVLQSAINTTTSATTVSSINTSNMEKILKCVGQRDYSSSYTAAVSDLMARKNGSALDVYCSNNMSGVQRIILQYTKTTDV